MKRREVMPGMAFVNTVLEELWMIIAVHSRGRDVSITYLIRGRKREELWSCLADGKERWDFGHDVVFLGCCAPQAAQHG